MIHTVRRGQYLHSLRPPCESSLPVCVTHLAMSWEGHVVVHTCVEGKATLKVKHTHLQSEFHLEVAVVSCSASWDWCSCIMLVSNAVLMFRIRTHCTCTQ